MRLAAQCSHSLPVGLDAHRKWATIVSVWQCKQLAPEAYIISNEILVRDASVAEWSSKICLLTTCCGLVAVSYLAIWLFGSTNRLAKGDNAKQRVAVT